MKNRFTPEGRGRYKAEYTAEEIYDAMRTGAIIEGTVRLCDSDMTLYVDLGCMQGVMPKELTCFTDGEIKDIAVITRVGRRVCFKVLAVEEAENSRRAVLSRYDAQKQCITEYLQYLRPGDIIPCTVTHTDRFGAFLDVGCGVTALLPVDRMSLSRIRHSEERVTRGDTVRCAVLSLEIKPFRMFLTLKELLGTFEENKNRFAPGQTVEGIVRGVEEYGIFVEIMPNLSGLSEYREGYSPSDSVSVYIKNMDASKMKVKLVIVGALGKAETRPLEYFVPESVDHISVWRYSPVNAAREIITDFDGL